MPESKYPKVLLPALVSALLALALGSLVLAQERVVDHVLLISIDGLRPEFYLDPSWPAPLIQQMAAEGAVAQAVRGVFPTVTYPSHTTIVTGALPARHGIYYNTPFESAGQTGRWYWEATSVKVRTLWDAVREAGLESAAVTWPVTVDAPIARLIPEVWPLDTSAGTIDLIRRSTKPAGLLEEVESEATGRLSDSNFSMEYLSRDDQAGRTAAYILEKYKPALLAVHLLSTDHYQHIYGREHAMVRQAVAQVDHAVNLMREAVTRAGIADRTAFIITGDHGFVNVHTQLSPNIWLAEAGLLEPAKDRGNWRAVFHASGGSAFLHLRDSGDVEALQQVREILKRLPAKYHRLFRVIESAELRAVGADPSSPLALAAAPGYALSSAADGPLIRAARGGAHGFFPSDTPLIATGFIGYGPGFRKGVVAHEIGLEDIAPLIARLLDLSFEAPDGILPEGLLTGK